MVEEKEGMELEVIRLRNQEAHVCSMDDLTKSEAREQDSMGKIYKKFLPKHLVDHNGNMLDSYPVCRSAARIFVRLPEPLILAVQWLHNRSKGIR